MDAKDENGRLLEPVDAGRCQCEELSGSFMTIGPRKMVRCDKTPVYLAVGVRDGKFYGAMSLCEEHKVIAETREPGIHFQRFLVRTELTERGYFSGVLDTFMRKITVSELIAALQEQPHDAEVYMANFASSPTRFPVTGFETEALYIGNPETDTPDTQILLWRSE